MNSAELSASSPVALSAPVAPFAAASAAPLPRLLCTNSLLAINKYVATALSAAGFAFSLMTKDDFFAYVGFAMALMASAASFLQSGLIRLKPSARIFAILHACFSLFSLFLPLAALALAELFSDRTARAFAGSSPSSSEADQKIRRMYRATAIVFASVFVILLLTPHTLRMIRSL
jgi:hypothetical protein